MLAACKNFLRGVCICTGQRPGDALGRAHGRCDKGIPARPVRRGGEVVAIRCEKGGGRVRARRPASVPQPQGDGGSLPRPRQDHRGGTAGQAVVGDCGENHGARAPARGHKPEHQAPMSFFSISFP